MTLGQVGRAAIIALAALLLAAGAVAASSVRWSQTRQLVATSAETFSPELAVNHAGVAVAAWFSGPPPLVTAGAGPTQAGTRWTGNQVVAALGSVARGLGNPVVIAKNGTDVEGQIKVALSGAGVAYVAWLRSNAEGSMIAAAHEGHLSAPRTLMLPRGAQLDRLAFGLNGPVDALSDRPNGHGFTFFCTALGLDGRSGRTFIAAHPYKPDPCHLPHTSGMNGSSPPDGGQPHGYRRASYSLVSRSDGTGDALAIWDDWPDKGPAYTYGLFYAVRRS